MPSREFLISLVDELNEKLGDKPFYTLRQLISVGFFGSMHAARRALQEGRISFVRISPRRSVIPRTVLLEYLRKNFSEQSIENE